MENRDQYEMKNKKLIKTDVWQKISKEWWQISDEKSVAS